MDRKRISFERNENKDNDTANAMNTMISFQCQLRMNCLVKPSLIDRRKKHTVDSRMNISRQSTSFLNG